jgi:hypothetical protein
MKRNSYCIYVNTVCDGPVPVERDEHGNPVTYLTRTDAEKVIAEDVIERLRQFLDDEREFDDALTIEEYVTEVKVLPDGSIVDAAMNHFSYNNW